MRGEALWPPVLKARRCRKRQQYTYIHISVLMYDGKVLLSFQRAHTRYVRRSSFRASHVRS